MSNKIVDGVELLRMIRDGEIESGKKVRNIGRFAGSLKNNYFIVATNRAYNNSYIFPDDNRVENRKVEIQDLLCDRFEILSSEPEEIDIESIEETAFEGFDNLEDMIRKIRDKQTILIDVVKQINRKVEGK